MGTRRILIVDDEDDIREIAQLSLEISGRWEVVAAACGSEALCVAAETRPAAILLDVMMPGLDGPTTLGRLRQNPVTADIPVIFLTAKAQSGERRQLLDLGARGVIAKPFDPMTLGQEITSVLGTEEQA